MHAEAEPVAFPEVVEADIFPVGAHFAGVDERREAHELDRRPLILGAEPEGVLILEPKFSKAPERVDAADVGQEVEGHAVPGFVVRITQPEAPRKHVLPVGGEWKEVNPLGIEAMEVVAIERAIVPGPVFDAIEAAARRSSGDVADVELGEDRRVQEVWLVEQPGGLIVGKEPLDRGYLAVFTLTDARHHIAA